MSDQHTDGWKIQREEVLAWNKTPTTETRALGDWGDADPLGRRHSSAEPSAETLPPLTATQEAIQDECDAICNMLLRKNRLYGDSAIHPRPYLSDADAHARLRMRIDDKINRLVQGGDDTEDTELDLIGYLVLLRVLRRLEK